MRKMQSFLLLGIIALAYADDSDLSTSNRQSRNQVPVVSIALDSRHPAISSDISPKQMNLNNLRESLKVMEDSNNIDGGLNTSLSLFEEFFKGKFEFNVDRLPDSSFLFPSPWPSDYWPTYKDGINDKWESPNSMSAPEKYAKAFNLNTTAVLDGVSAYSGIDSLLDTKMPCTTDSDCLPQHDASTCGIRVGKTSGVCIPSWYGICHAWSPASIMENEPKCPVVYNGITFNVMDLKALVTFMYDRTGVNTIFGANRCYDNKTTLDIHGRIDAVECRDMTADFFHVMTTNIIGRFNSSFVADVDATNQVWNQPVRGYQVLSKYELDSISAAKLINPLLDSYIFNPDAKRFLYFKMKFSYVNEALSLYALGSALDVVAQYTKDLVFEYILELTDSGRIIGGEWLNESKTSHPDFLWIPTNRPPGSTTIAEINFDKVRALLKLSVDADC